MNQQQGLQSRPQKQQRAAAWPPTVSALGSGHFPLPAGVCVPRRQSICTRRVVCACVCPPLRAPTCPVSNLPLRLRLKAGPGARRATRHGWSRLRPGYAHTQDDQKLVRTHRPLRRADMTKGAEHPVPPHGTQQISKQPRQPHEARARVTQSQARRRDGDMPAGAAWHAGSVQAAAGAPQKRSSSSSSSWAAPWRPEARGGAGPDGWVEKPPHWALVAGAAAPHPARESDCGGGVGVLTAKAPAADVPTAA